MHRSGKGKYRAFYERPLSRIQTVYSKDSESKKPSLEADDDVLTVYFRLCKAGYASSIQQAKELNAREVVQALYYEKFCNEYEKCWMEINKK